MSVCLCQGFLQQLRQVVNRMGSGPRGAGLGVKLLIGAGALAYGVKEATYTGKITLRIKKDTHSRVLNPYKFLTCIEYDKRRIFIMGFLEV